MFHSSHVLVDEAVVPSFVCYLGQNRAKSLNLNRRLVRYFLDVLLWNNALAVSSCHTSWQGMRLGAPRSLQVRHPDGDEGESEDYENGEISPGCGSRKHLQERKETMQAPAHEIDREGERDQYTNGYGFLHKCHTRLRRWNKRAPLSECRRRDEFYLGAVWLTIL
jgi:hypothetical protein